jgi:hypothetical protein
MCQLAIHTHNIESCSDKSITPKEILVALGLQFRKCNLLELIPKACASIMSFLCPRGFSIHPSFSLHYHP